MNAKDVMREVAEMSHMVVRFYIEDLTDADLLVRSVPGTNHIAWQMGHLVAGTASMIRALGRTAPDLPAGFEQSYTKETASSDDPSKFHSKAEYLALMDRMKAATLAAIDATGDAELAAPGPESMREYAPTVASVLTLLGSHWLMHAGQFVPIRRKLGKPALF
ncbi:MAG: DinB family protein [Rhodopirellula sp.]|nr:DinB family protein [Rhodopirellula sp.]